MDEGASGYSVEHAIDCCIRYAMHILEDEQTPLFEPADVAARVERSRPHLRLFTGSVGLNWQAPGAAFDERSNGCARTP